MNIVDFILEYAYLLVYALTVFVALWRYPRYFDTVFKYLPILLMYTLITEVGGNIIKSSDEYDFVLSDLLDYNNWVIYNLYDIIFFLYFLYVYWLSIKKRKYRRIIEVGVGMFILAAIINPFLSDFKTRFQMITYFTGAIALITAIVMYFRQLKSTTGTWFLNRNLLCWLSIGIIVFLVGYIPLIILGHFGIVIGEDYQIIRRLHLLLILIMYGSFIIGFINMARKPLKAG
ncbi:MAG: hypothetical protein ACR2MM_06520 [Flavobacteriaceae bacterium]